jgi:hypothetical protein
MKSINHDCKMPFEIGDVIVRIDSSPGEHWRVIGWRVCTIRGDKPCSDCMSFGQEVVLNGENFPNLSRCITVCTMKGEIGEGVGFKCLEHS